MALLRVEKFSRSSPRGWWNQPPQLNSSVEISIETIKKILYTPIYLLIGASLSSNCRILVRAKCICCNQRDRQNVVIESKWILHEILSQEWSKTASWSKKKDHSYKNRKSHRPKNWIRGSHTLHCTPKREGAFTRFHEHTRVGTSRKQRLWNKIWTWKKIHLHTHTSVAVKFSCSWWNWS